MSCRRQMRCSGSRPRSGTRRRPSWRPTAPASQATFGSATSARSRRCRSAGTRRSRAGWRSASATWLPIRRSPAVPARSCSRRTADRSRSPRETDADGLVRATLTSVATWVREPEPALTAAALELLGWRADELDPALPPALGFAGATHLILAARELARLERLAYPFDDLKALMLEHDLTTIQLVWREKPGPVPRARPVPGRRRRRGSRHGRGGRRARRLPARPRGDRGPGLVRDRPGRRDGPPEPAHRVHRAGRGGRARVGDGRPDPVIVVRRDRDAPRTGAPGRSPMPPARESEADARPCRSGPTVRAGWPATPGSPGGGRRRR